MKDFDISQIKFGPAGLIPAIVKDHHTGEVLMLAYMNEESLNISLAEGRTCFYSRSRQKLWRKGETSGNVQHIVSIVADCDFDTLLISVTRDGPACHTGRQSCFFNPIHGKYVDFSAQKLYALINERKKELPAGSYTTYLFEKGVEKILKKVGEESSEVIISAMKKDKRETVCETADLYYHMLVLLAQMEIPLEEIYDELASRHIIDHKVKQEPPI